MKCKSADDATMTLEYMGEESTVNIPNLDNTVCGTGSKIIRSGVDVHDVHGGVMGFGKDGYRLKGFGKGGRKGWRK